jgi:hypothetical protein
MAALTLITVEVPLFEHTFLAGGHDLPREDPVGLFRLVTRRLRGGDRPTGLR